jgi:methylglutaconyl-CoA hydratase
MKKTQSYTHAENLKDAERLAEVLYLLFSLPQPTIARVNGPAYGGGVGLISVCDFAISVDTAKFKLSEVSLGLVPSVISPYLLKRIGEKTCRELFLTARFFTPVEAKEYGLLNDVVTNENLNSSMKNLINKLLSNSPNALASCKKLLAKLPDEDLPKSKISTANLLAHMRSSNEAQEGINAFFEKRKPNWHDEIQDYDI